jgi:hypothetical protein
VQIKTIGINNLALLFGYEGVPIVKNSDVDWYDDVCYKRISLPEWGFFGKGKGPTQHLKIALF